MATAIGTELISEIPPTFPKSDQIIQPTRVKSSGPKKKLLRRTGHDYSQALRRGYQLGFLLINLWLGGVFYAWVLCLGSLLDVGSFHCCFHAQRLRPDCGRQDAEFLPHDRGNWRDRDKHPDRGFGFHPEFLVPVPVSVWSAAGACVSVESARH